MTDSDTRAPRANRDGHPCPPWCRTDHDEALVPGKPELGYMDTHISDPVTPPETRDTDAVQVRTWHYPDDAEPAVYVRDRFGLKHVKLSAGDAETLAGLIALITENRGNAGRLAGDLAVAAAAARGEL